MIKEEINTVISYAKYIDAAKDERLKTTSSHTCLFSQCHPKSARNGIHSPQESSPSQQTGHGSDTTETSPLENLQGEQSFCFILQFIVKFTLNICGGSDSITCLTDLDETVFCSYMSTEAEAKDRDNSKQCDPSACDYYYLAVVLGVASPTLA